MLLNYRWLLLIVLLLLVIAIGAVYSKKPSVGESFALEVSACNNAPIEERFSCYQKVLNDNRGKVDLENYLKDIEGNTNISYQGLDESYAIFGTNCHTFYHALGDYIAREADEANIDSLIKSCPLSCTAGCMMGLYKRTALERGFDTNLLKDFYNSCPEDVLHSCAHEVGHVLHDKYSYSILKLLDDISVKEYGWQAPSEYRYALYDKADLNLPFEECRAILPENELPYCYTGIGHNLFLFSEFSPDGYKELAKDCNDTKPENRDACYDFLIYRVGINDSAPRFISGDIDGGREVCDEVTALAGDREDLKKHCYIGVGGGIGLFLDSEYINVEITPENLSNIQEDVLEKINLCEEAEGEHSLDCYKGLLGTPAKKLYKTLNLNQVIIEDILPQIESDFEVVG